MCDGFVEIVALPLRNCIAQRLRCGRDPALEEASLMREPALRGVCSAASGGA
jgi:hypothetical protein